MEEMKKVRYIGVYNYVKNDLHLRKMVEFDGNIDVVRKSISEHIENNDTDPSNYHISVYECYNWGDQNGHDLPIKISEESYQNEH